MNILFAGSDTKCQGEVVALMEHNGYQVYSAFSASEALDTFIQKKIDLVIMDAYIKELDSVEILKILRRINEEAEVIFLTCLDDVETARRSLGLGAVDFLIKPINITDLLSSIKETKAYKKNLQKQTELSVMEQPLNQAAKQE